MASLVWSILNNSATKIESITKIYKSTHDANTEYIPSPPPYDLMQQSNPTPSPSSSWTLSETSHKSNKSNVDRHSISQGMKLVSIAADEYEEGNESMALDIYLTGVDKILMALPNKADINTKIAIKEKLTKVEERVGIFQSENRKTQTQEEQHAAVVQTFLLSRLTSTVSSISTKAVKAVNNGIDQHDPSKYSASYCSNDTDADPMTRFKQFCQYMVEVVVAFAILVKQSPIPDLVSFIFGYLFQIFLWIDAQYQVKKKVQDFGIYCIKYGIEADEKYHLHVYITECMYTIIAAGLKAVVAYKETPRHKEATSTRDTIKLHETAEHHKSSRLYVKKSIQSIHSEEITRKNHRTVSSPGQTRKMSMGWTPW